MTVIDRLYTNAWYVTHAAPEKREQLAADVTRTWMAAEAAVEDANRARTVSGLSPARSALALSIGNSAQAEYHRARSRALEAARCTDIIAGHAFTITRTGERGGPVLIEIASCTLPRTVSLSQTQRGGEWTATMTDPQSRHAERFTTLLGSDPWDAMHRACDWITSGQL
ncbi:hypothetical protein [Phycicoccus sp. 3266]|jgi:hypothetical protein|uniref:hypothetical protein n=1 Tax=Phycicoccus sp. 3266 TaxID=2817751 RepID=UPI002856E190|nr:hypothetical protein [Phycicoccus sp. 3266]MDR6863280.1 hypothetical protein [Phycicoccus sp. 3266]